jgi:hypothetical protein
MSDDLYFVKWLDAAWAQPDRPAALRAALAAIRDAGQTRRYRRGYRQFVHWLHVVARAHRAGGYVGVDSPPPAKLQRAPRLSLCLARNGVPLADVPLAGRGPARCPGLTPGAYVIGLDTGRRLWAGTLTPRGAFVAQPGADQPLTAAAATAGPPRDRLTLWDGQLTLRLRPAGGAWTLEVELGDPRS